MSEKMHAYNSIEVSGPDQGRVLVKLSGEFDIDDLDALHDLLEGVSGREKVVCVDLSGITFLDALCARELTDGSCFCGGYLVLRNPSWQAESSFVACSLEGVFDSRVIAEDRARGMALGGSCHERWSHPRW